MKLPEITSFARLFGVLLRSVLLGTLLFWAIVEIVSVTEAARIFRYQDF